MKINPSTALRMNPSIFRAYDIRGKYTEELNEDAAQIIVRAFVRFFGKTSLKILVSHDTRPSSASLADAVTRGLVSEGCEVTSIGLATTPMHHWVVWKEGFDGGVMVTASHLPLEWNGLKLFGERGKVIAKSSGLEELAKMAQETNETNVPKATTGFIRKKHKDYLASYVSFLASQIQNPPLKPLKLAIDGANGTVPKVLVPLLSHFKELGVRFLCFDTDGRVRHDPSPQKDENLCDLKEELSREHYDIGAAFDGDGDRVVFLTPKGERISPDFITALLAKHFLKSNPGEKIVADVPSSQIVRETVEAQGDVLVLAKTGHSWMQAKMEEVQAVFGGEHTGHYYFKETGYGEGAILAFLKLLEVLSREQKSIEELLAPLLSRYVRSGELNFPAKGEVTAAPSNLEKHFSGGKISRLDGLTVEYPDWWFNLRASETEPVLRLNIEAQDRATLERHQRELEKLLL